MQRVTCGGSGHDAFPARDTQRRSLLAAAELEREPLPAHSGMALSHAGGAPGVPPSGPGGGTRRWAAMRGGGGGARLGGLAWPRMGQPGAAAHGGNVSGAPAAAYGKLLGVRLVRSSEGSWLLHGAAGLASAKCLCVLQMEALDVMECCMVGALELVQAAWQLTGGPLGARSRRPPQLSRRGRTLAAAARPAACSACSAAPVPRLCCAEARCGGVAPRSTLP
jgi:hypothetical protein